MGRYAIQQGINKSGVVVSGNSSGIDMYTGFVVNTKGGWVEIAPPTDRTYGEMTIYFRAGSGSNNTTSFLVDIGFGTGPIDVVVENLICGVHINNGNAMHVCTIPIYIPAGTRVVARCSGNPDGTFAGNLQIRIGCTLRQRSRQWPTGWEIKKVLTRGAVPGDSGGTEIDPGPTQNTKGGWIQVNLSLPHTFKWLLIGVGSRNNPNIQSIAENMLLDVGIQIGGVGAIEILIPDINMNCPQGIGLYMPMYLGGYFVNIPEDSLLFARASSSETDGNNRLFDVIYYGGY